jgi:hypothetical protein
MKSYTAKTQKNSDKTLLDHKLQLMLCQCFILLIIPYRCKTVPNVYSNTSANVVTAVAPRTV